MKFVARRCVEWKKEKYYWVVVEIVKIRVSVYLLIWHPRRWNIQADPKRMRFAGHSFANVSCNTEISGNSGYPFCFCATRNIPSLCFLWYFTKRLWCPLMRILLPWRCISTSLVHREFRKFLVWSYWLVLIFTYVYEERSKILKVKYSNIENINSSRRFSGKWLIN